MGPKSAKDIVCHYLRLQAWKGITQRPLMSGEAPAFRLHVLFRINLQHRQPHQARRLFSALRQESALLPKLVVSRRPSDSANEQGRTKQRKQDLPLRQTGRQLRQPVEPVRVSRPATEIPTVFIPVRPRRHGCKVPRRLSSKAPHRSPINEQT